jgi:hypothetical protein
MDADDRGTEAALIAAAAEGRVWRESAGNDAFWHLGAAPARPGDAGGPAGSARAGVSPQTLSELPGRYAVCRLAPGDPIPAASTQAALWCAARTEAELSVVCPEADAPAGARIEAGWAALALAGPFDL